MSKTTNADRARIIARDVKLVSVTLQRADLVSQIDPLTEQPPSIELSQQYRGRYEIPENRPDHIYVSVEFKCVGSGPTPEFGELFKLDATYLLVYKSIRIAERPLDALQHFAELNGTYNIWPYWREFVQTVAGRVGFGSVIVPVFHPPIREVDPETGIPIKPEMSASTPQEEPTVKKTPTRKKPPNKRKEGAT